MLLTEELSQSEAWRIHVELMRLDVSRQIHCQNREELLHALETLSHTDLLPNHLGKIAPPSIEAGTVLVLRLLHNYLASAVMLADHLYRFAEQKYSPEQRAAFLRECSTRWSGLPVYTFTRRLRVYALHLRIPLSIAQFEFTASGLETTVVLDGAELRSWDGWKAKGRTFLSELSDNVPLTEVVLPMSAPSRTSLTGSRDGMRKMFSSTRQSNSATSNAGARQSLTQHTIQRCRNRSK